MLVRAILLLVEGSACPCPGLLGQCAMAEGLTSKPVSCATLSQGISFMHDDLEDYVKRVDLSIEEKIAVASLISSVAFISPYC